MTTLLKVKNNTIILPTSIGKKLENKTVRLIDNGLVISITMIPLPESDLVMDKPKQNLQALKSALKNAVGIFPKNLDGLEYEDNIRKGWDKRLKQLWHEK